MRITYPIQLKESADEVGALSPGTKNIHIVDAEGKDVINGCHCCGSPFSVFMEEELQELIRRANNPR